MKIKLYNDHNILIIIFPTTLFFLLNIKITYILY